MKFSCWEAEEKFLMKICAEPRATSLFDEGVFVLVEDDYCKYAVWDFDNLIRPLWGKCQARLCS